MVMGMASYIKKGESILIPFRNGISITDSQLKPRMYKTVQAFKKSFPSHYLGTNGVELVEYAEVVRCKDCRFKTEPGQPNILCYHMKDNDFCSYGQRRKERQ